MNEFIDINDRLQLAGLLAKLTPDTKPLWGQMTARQMVEHLVDAVRYSNGEMVCNCMRPPEDVARDKQRMIYTNATFPKNVKLADAPEFYGYDSLGAAITGLLAALTQFDQYYKQGDVTAVHSGFGPLNHHEWLVWHGKHFTHHLKQFGLLPE